MLFFQQHKKIQKTYILFDQIKDYKTPKKPQAKFFSQIEKLL